MRALTLRGNFAAVVALAVPAPAAAVRELAYVGGTGAASELNVVRDDGSGRRRITNNRVADYSPAWSPDGRRVLFVSSRDGAKRLTTGSEPFWRSAS